MSQFSEGDAAVNRLTAATTAFEKVLTEPEGVLVPMPLGQPQPSLSERLKRALDAVTVQPAQAAAQATAAAQQASQSALAAAQSAADAASSAAATGYVDAPFPDVWAPLSDDLRLLAGFAPADTITVSGTSYPLPTKSMTFTRSTTATYIDKSGVLKAAAVNEPRFERDGLLMEGQSTNYFLNTDDPTKWNADVNVTKESIVDGSTQATTFKGTLTTSATNYLLTNSPGISCANGDTFTISARFKGAVGRVRFRFALDGNLVGDVYFDAVTGSVVGSPTGSITYTSSLGSDGYIYATATLTTNTAGAMSGNIWFNSNTALPVGSTIYIQTPQVEKNPVATSYIPTGAAAVTRSADNVTLQSAGNCGLRLTSDLIQRTVSFELTVNGCGLTSGTLDLLETYGAGYDKILRLSVSGSYALSTYRSNTLTAVTGAYPFYRKMVTHTLDGNAVALYFDGKSARRDAAPFSPSAAAQYLQIKSTSAVVYHIRNLRIWHSALSDIQIKGLR